MTGKWHSRGRLLVKKCMLNDNQVKTTAALWWWDTLAQTQEPLGRARSQLMFPTFLCLENVMWVPLGVVKARSGCHRVGAGGGTERPGGFWSLPCGLPGGSSELGVLSSPSGSMKGAVRPPLLLTTLTTSVPEGLTLVRAQSWQELVTA